MVDEILDFFDSRKRGPESNRPHATRGVFDAFADDDDPGDEGRRLPYDDERRGDSRRDRNDRRDSVTDWD